MIVDSHCHAWRTWPYQPPVPGPTSRGTVEQLLWEMDQHGVLRVLERPRQALGLPLHRYGRLGLPVSALPPDRAGALRAFRAGAAALGLRLPGRAAGDDVPA